jgi:hypothetical protein
MSYCCLLRLLEYVWYHLMVWYPKDPLLVESFHSGFLKGCIFVFIMAVLMWTLFSRDWNATRIGLKCHSVCRHHQWNTDCGWCICLSVTYVNDIAINCQLGSTGFPFPAARGALCTFLMISGLLVPPNQFLNGSTLLSFLDCCLTANWLWNLTWGGCVWSMIGPSNVST